MTILRFRNIGAMGVSVLWTRLPVLSSFSLTAPTHWQAGTIVGTFQTRCHQTKGPDGETGSDRSPALRTTPRDWTLQSSAFEALTRADMNVFQEQDFAPESVQEALDKLEIRTLSDLHGALNDDGDRALLTANALGKAGIDYAPLKALLAPIFEVPEVQLAGRTLVLKGAEEIMLVQERFVEKAIAVDGPDKLVGKGSRDMDIVGVYGSSGSGKTFFATRGLPAVEGTELCTLYVKMSQIQNPVEYLEQIEDEIEKRLMKEAPTFDPAQQLNMTLSLVVDEASAVDNFLGNLDNLEPIYKSVGKFAKHPRLVIGGTGFDAISQSLSSDRDIRKYKMRPWTPAEVEYALWKEILFADKASEIRQEIEKRKVYSDLATNPRAARALAVAIRPRLGYRELQRIASIPNVVDEVSSAYIKGNGIQDLSPQQRRQVARAVFKVLEVASRRPEEAFWPDFMQDGDLESELRLRSTALGLVDINVETRNGTAELVDKSYPYSVSVTPAITVVLYSMLGIIGGLMGGWSEFEVLAALYEIKHLVLASGEEQQEYNLVYLGSAFPATRATNNFQVPILASNAVYVNGERASFADVLAPFRLIQCKYTEKSNEELGLDIAAELSKMGVLSSSEPVKKALLSAIYASWQNKQEYKDKTVQWSEVKEAASSGGHTGVRMYYPTSLLLGPSTKFNQYSQFVFDDNELKSSGETNVLASSAEAYRGDEKLDNVKVVFHTNAKSLRLGSTVITSEDVDIDGEVGDAKKKEFLDSFDLREGVTLRFLFVPTIYVRAGMPN